MENTCCLLFIMRKHRFFSKMIRKSIKLFLWKYLFFGLLIICVMVGISLLYFSNSVKLIPNDDDLSNISWPPPRFSKDILDKNFEDCLIPNFNHIVSNNSLKLNIKANISLPYDTVIRVMSNERLRTLLKFTDLTHQLGIESIIIEPSLLFCIISPNIKYVLHKRNFTFYENTNEHVIELGILTKMAAKFDKEHVRNNLTEEGYHIEIVRADKPRWMRLDNSSSFISHIFLKKNLWTIHFVVFHEKSNFLWYSSLQSPTKNSLNQSFLFLNEDSAFDKFSIISLNFKHPLLNHFNIPSDPAHFLYQIESSRFLECNRIINDRFEQLPLSTNLPSVHSDLSVPHFNHRLVIALLKLKEKLDPMFIRFWIWSGTMLGWYRQCDVIPYTTDVDFASWASDVDDLDSLIHSLLRNEHLEIKQKMGLIDEGLEFNLNCHGLRVDLFFVYLQDNGTWYAGHCPKTGNYFKYHHPNFKLCSAELLQQKVLVPCETENVISAEYGSDWMNPITSWHYEKSPKNRGPDIFWDKSILNKAYINY